MKTSEMNLMAFEKSNQYVFRDNLISKKNYKKG